VRLGHQIVIITPFYEKIIDKEKFGLKLIKENSILEIDKENKVSVDFWQGELSKGIPVYFVSNKKYFSRHQYLYGLEHENAKFLLFNLASLYLLELINFQPDLIHCHDWQTGILPYLFKKKLRFKNHPFYKKIAVLFTIHNLTFQMGKNWWEVPQDKKDNGRKALPLFNDPELENINFVKRGIIYADLINAVSERYAKEILTPEFGQSLERTLKTREKDVFGIINGIDYKVHNPQFDKNIWYNYDWNSLDKKKKNKLELQKMVGLEEKEDIPLIGLASRLTEQKGFDLIRETMWVLAKLKLQIVMVGDGEKEYIQYFKKKAKKYSHKLGLYTPFSEEIESKILAGSDMFLLPSHFEPCGISQLKSLRYGSVPIVHQTGGLSDTITDFDSRTGEGNGFVFPDYTREDFLIALARAMENYKYPQVWTHLTWRAMQETFSWDLPAKKYVDLYQKAMKKTSN
jgi:starch synthase